MPKLQANGATLAYTDTGAPPGRPDAPTVVFGHGLLFGGWMFESQIASLRETYRCVAVDWRGQGNTPATASGYDMDSLTADVVAVIEDLGVAPAHFVGLSMGGFVGMRLAARHGQLLRSLTLLGTNADGQTADSSRRFKQLAAVYRLLGLAPVRKQVLSIQFGQSFLASPNNASVLADWERRLRRTGRAGISKAVRGVADHEAIADELKNVTVPTLVIVGTEDVATPLVQSERIVERIKHARLDVVTVAGHSSTLENPGAVTTLLTDFLASVEARPS
jgi:pimeloyl-ACP methyl ester carboxylesterase